MPSGPIIVCGAGLMGHGIAQVFAAAGHHVALYEPELERAEAGRDRIAANLAAGGRQGEAERRASEPRRWRASMPTETSPRRPTSPSPSRPSSRTGGQDGPVGRARSGCPGRRHPGLEHELDPHHPPGRRRQSDRRAEVVGMHFFSPVPVMPLIELVRGRGDVETPPRRPFAAWSARARQTGHRQPAIGRASSSTAS